MQTDKLRPGPDEGRRAFRVPGTAHVISRELVSRLRELAGMVRRLPPPSSRRPDAFHEARSELAHELVVLAADFDQALHGSRRSADHFR